MPLKEVKSAKVFAAPAAPFSTAIVSTGSRLLHISGQVPVDLDGNTVAKGDIAGQTEHVLKTIEHILAEEGATFANLCKLTIFMTARDQLPTVVAVRKRLFPQPYPATSAVIVAGLNNPDWLIEIEGMAVLD
jgi:enamine deaminase RidA (YjgF/YER057c/UK114 family)